MMYWICVFALIMEIVFRAQNKIPSNSQKSDPKQGAPIELNDEVVIPGIPLGRNTNAARYKNYLPADFSLASKGIIYIVRSNNDGSLLAATATLSIHCIYQASGINSIVLPANDKILWFNYVGDSHEQFITFLWEVYPVGRSLFLQPAAIARMSEWTWRDNVINVEKETPEESTTVTAREVQRILNNNPEPESPPPNSPEVLTEQDVPDKSTTTTTTEYDPEKWNNNNKHGRNRNHHRHGKHHPKKLSNDEVDPASVRKKRSQEDIRTKRQIQSESSDMSSLRKNLGVCSLNSSKIMWNTPWELFLINSDNVIGESYQIRDVRSRCLQAGGFFGICRHQKLASHSNSSWHFQPVADLIL